MRLIDADALFEFIQKERAWKQSTMKYPRYEQGKYDAFYEMLDIIKEQPAVDAVSLVRCEKCSCAVGNGKFFYCHKICAFVPKDFGCIKGERKEPTRE